MWGQAVRRRRLIGLVLIFSALFGAYVAYRPGLPPESRQYTVWLASADVLVDTADSQVVDSQGPDFLSLANRTSLLGNLIGTTPLRTAIAREAGVDPNRLVVVPPANTSSTVIGGTLPPTPVTTAASREVPDSEVTQVTVSTDPSLPILRVGAQAPNASTASRLTTATSAALERHLETVSATEHIPAARKLVVRPLAAPTPVPETRGTPRVIGLLAAVMVGLLGCAVIVTAPMIARRWRNAEAAPPDPPTATDPGSNVPFDHVAGGDHERWSAAAVAELAAQADTPGVADFGLAEDPDYGEHDIYEPDSAVAPSARREHGRVRDEGNGAAR
jgi:hypothetical protein